MTNFKIAFVGYAGSGKSTLANYLVKTYDAKRYSFADAVKEVATKYFGMIEKDRSLLQKIGARFREINPDVWVNIVIQKIKTETYANVVIDDCRYLNEAFALRKEGFTIVKIIGRKAKLTPEQSLHSSEREQDEIYPDYTINNNGTLEDSYTQLEYIIKTENLFKKKVKKTMKRILNV
jgi:dephospho-CoA kinase